MEVILSWYIKISFVTILIGLLKLYFYNMGIFFRKQEIVDGFALMWIWACSLYIDHGSP